jgi:hypothetical protein
MRDGHIVADEALVLSARKNARSGPTLETSAQ